MTALGSAGSETRRAGRADGVAVRLGCWLKMLDGCEGRGGAGGRTQQEAEGRSSRGSSGGQSGASMHSGREISAKPFFSTRPTASPISSPGSSPYGRPQRAPQFSPSPLALNTSDQRFRIKHNTYLPQKRCLQTSDFDLTSSFLSLPVALPLSRPSTRSTLASGVCGSSPRIPPFSPTQATFSNSFPKLASCQDSLIAAGHQPTPYPRSRRCGKDLVARHPMCPNADFVY
ncbi:unnamed protein product [Cyclocybe aegerita]|uniref:Uncharacterized protein n=1 Tax=Cyclocybe aegerita TaxID=1973307 RepID=A0A8S0VR41_CYCAE|nr:unnamed protein product [Cyclocybe aegerita]